MKHTPGPWQYVFEGGTVAFIVEADGATIAKLSVTENSTAHSALPANARLIAASPDLLKALKEVIYHAAPICECAYGPDMGAAFDQARAAIAKATGETK